MMYAFLACPLFSSFLACPLFSPPGKKERTAEVVCFSYFREMRSYDRGNAFVLCGNGLCTLWKRVAHPVEMGRVPCGNESCTLWKWVVYPVETGRVPCGNGLRTLWEGDACCENGADGNLA